MKMLKNFQYLCICTALLATATVAKGPFRNLSSANNVRDIVPLPSSSYIPQDDLCANNPSGNYPDPLDCTQFIQCQKTKTGGNSHIQPCPPGYPLLYYVPFVDLCSYAENNQECPQWRSTWNDVASVTCDRIGQRPWSSYLTLPAEPNTLCGPNIIRCFRWLEMERTQCPQGTGYSKAYMGCLTMDNCKIVDKYIFEINGKHH